MQALQDLLPGRERVEKALLLNQAASYISQLQVCLHLLLNYVLTGIVRWSLCNARHTSKSLLSLVC